MQKIHPQFILFVLFFINCISCSEYVKEGDRFFVRSEGATMPVIIKGNMESRTFVIFLHGGPGSNATQASFLPVFQELEANFAIAYWDQRASGLSQGNPDKSTFTVEQFEEDLDLVVNAIILRYDSPDIYLFGHSWGGALGCAYLSSRDQQQKIKGFINMDSGHNLLEGLPKSVAWMLEYAHKKIDQGEDTAYWTEVRDWCAAAPDMTDPDNYFTYADYIQETNAYRFDEDQEVQKAQIDGAVIFRSYMSLATFFNGRYLSRNFNILELNLSQQMQQISVPTLVMWGRHDGVNTIEMGFDAFNSIGGENFSGKSMVIFENSAHEAYVEEPDAFLYAFRSFIDSTR